MQRIKLILSDIDGTILPYGEPVVPERVRDAFHVALDAGIAIGPCSGRSLAQLPRFFGGDEACCATAIATNGLETYHDGKLIERKVLPHAALERTCEVVSEIPHAGMLCFEGTQPYLCAGAVEDLERPARDYAAVCKPHEGVPEWPVVKANVFVDADLAGTEEFVATMNKLVDGLDFDVPSVGFSNVMPTGWNKGTAVRSLCEHLGIGIDEVVVFGDAGNDLTMFRAVPNSVAVAGAMPIAAQTAKWHIGRCEDHAVADAVLALAAGEWPFTK